MKITNYIYTIISLILINIYYINTESIVMNQPEQNKPEPKLTLNQELLKSKTYNFPEQINIIKANSTQEFDEIINEHHYNLLIYVIKDCVQCDILKDSIIEMTNDLYYHAEDYALFELEKNIKNFKIHLIDLTENLYLTKGRTFDTFPLITIQKKGDIKDYIYKGPKEASDLRIFLYQLVDQKVIFDLKTIEEVEYFNKKLPITALLVTLIKEVNINYYKFIQGNPNIIFGRCNSTVYNSNNDEELDLDIDKDSNNNTVEETVEDKCISMFNITSGSAVVIKRDFKDEEKLKIFENFYPENSPHHENEKETLQKFSLFIDKSSWPMINFMTEKVINKIISSNRPSLVIFNTKKSEETYQKINDELYSIKEQLNKDQIFIVIGDEDFLLTKHIRNYFGITDKSVPAMKLYIPEEKPIKFTFNTNRNNKDGSKENEINAASILKFLNDCKHEQTPQDPKSQAIPNNEGNKVMTIVGYNFAEVVTEDKDVLVEFFSDNCPHCQDFKATYEEIGRLYEDNDDVIIANINIEENPLNIGIKSLPSIVLWRKEDKQKPLLYSWDKNLSDLINFMKLYSTSKAAPKEEL